MDAPTFMSSPLVVWVQTFSAERLSYEELCNGIFLAEVMQQIDPKMSMEGVSFQVEEAKDRLLNWEILMKSIYSYYREVLQQHVILQPPDISVICCHSESDASHVELERVLLLLLGCAIQSEIKVEIIENIKRLDTDIQCSIANYIQTITDHGRSVFPCTFAVEEMNDFELNLYTHLCSLLQQRDSYVKTVRELQIAVEEVDDVDDILPKTVSSSNVDTPVITEVTPSTPDSKKLHVSVELAQCKARLRRLRHELDDKNDAVEELQEELETLKQNQQRMHLENRELLEEARAAKYYRDELDIYKDKAGRVEKYEMEITRLKEKLNELDFYRARVDELRTDNSALIDTNQQLTDQLEECHKRIECIVDLENDLHNYKNQLATCQKELDDDRQHIVQLMRENTRLEFDRKLTSGENCSVDEHLQMAFNSASDKCPSLMDQLSETVNSQILRLELDNQCLRRQLDEIREKGLIENAAKMLELEKENNRLSEKVEKLIANVSECENRNKELVRSADEVSRTQKHLEDTLDTVRQNSERNIRELEKEKEHLMQTVESMRERNEQIGDTRILEAERENKRLTDVVNNYMNQIADLEHKNKQLESSSTKLIAEVEQLRQLEEAAEKYRREVSELQRTVDVLQTSCQHAETVKNDAAKLEIENMRLSKTVDHLQQNAARKEELELENTKLNVEVQQLKWDVESLKATSAQVVDLQLEKEQLSASVRRAEEGLLAKETLCKQLDSKLSRKDEQLHQLEEKLKTLSHEVEVLQEQYDSIEAENKKLSGSLDDKKLVERKLESLDAFSKELESENRRLLKEKQGLDKETRKLKQLLEDKDSRIEEQQSKLVELESTNKALNKATAQVKELEDCIHELEQENSELNQKLKIESKTVIALQKDLVTEKVTTQQLNDEVGRLSKQTENFAKSESVSSSEQLESEKEEQYRNQVASFEQQIADLQSCLEGYKNENKKLLAELESSRSQTETPTKDKDKTVTVTQRYSHVGNIVGRVGPTITSLSTTAEQARAANVVRVGSAVSPTIVTAIHLENSKIQQQQQQQPETTVNATGCNGVKTKASVGGVGGEVTYTERAVVYFGSAAAADNERQKQSSSSSSSNWTTEIVSSSTKQPARVDGSSKTGGSIWNGNGQLQQTPAAPAYNDLQTKLATVQVENSMLISQNQSLHSQKAQLNMELSTLEAKHQSTANKLAQLNSVISNIERDHEALQQLHNRLSQEHESLLTDYNTLKSNFKDVKSQLRTATDESSALRREMQTVAEIRTSLERDRANETQCYSTLQSNYVKVREENLHLTNSNDRLSSELRQLQSELRANKSRLNSAKTAKDELEGHVQDRDGQIRAMEMEMSRLMSRNKMLTDCNVKLEDENRNLMANLQRVMLQNQELLNQLLNNKDQQVEERNYYSEKLFELEHQKQKLHEKMEQIKKDDDFGKARSSNFATSIVKKFRIIRSKPDSSAVPDGTDNSSLGSVSLGKSTENLPHSDADRYAAGFNIKHGVSRRTKHGSEGSSPSIGTGSVGEQCDLVTNTAQTPNSASANGNEDDNEAITLDQFLQECNRSPKSRRRLLVEKRVLLDDAVERKSDRSLPSMPPRPATIYIEPDESNVTRLRQMKSEINISSHTATDENDQLARPQTLNRYKSRQRVANRQLVTSVSVCEGNRQQQQQQQMLAMGDAVVQPQQHHVHRPEATSYTAAAGGGSARKDNSSGSANTGNVVRRPKSVPPNRVGQPLPQTCESYVKGETDRRDSGMTSQYAPGNVRHLVQSYQSAFRPAPNSTAARGRTPSAEASPVANGPANGLGGISWQEQVDALLGELSRDQRKPLPETSSRNQRLTSSERQGDDNVNVCVVRPAAATGKTLPVTPVRQSQSNNGQQQQQNSESANKVVYQFACL